MGTKLDAALAVLSERRTTLGAQRGKRDELARALEQTTDAADTARKDLGKAIAEGSAVTAAKAALTAAMVEIEGYEAAVEVLDDQIRTETTAVQRAGRQAVRIEIQETLALALQRADETRERLDGTAESHGQYILLVRKIGRLARAINEMPPVDLVGSHAALFGVGDGPDLWSILHARGLGRDFTATGESFSTLACQSDRVLLDDDENLSDGQDDYTH